MGYQALLFCPDEKLARTVTQVLTELEFSSEACTEPFAAVKKLMGQHFDAIVVDCENEQNATLLFKSARNSSSNQASLAVAVVEGQTGVAKAFRIGANLVLTKPINVEQAKGTLRVARGLLRKGEPGKPATTPAAAPAAAPAPAAASPAPAKPAAPVAPVPRPVTPSVAKPVASPAASVQAATASSAPVVRDDEVPAVKSADAPAPVKAPVQAAPTTVKKAPAPAVSAAKATPAPVPAIVATASASGAASAPAPAREAQEASPADATPASPASVADVVVESPTVEKPSAPSDSTAEPPVPTFTFGGANVPAESSGGPKRVVLGLAVTLLLAAGAYAGWTYYNGRATEPAAKPASPPVTTPQVPKPTAVRPASSSPTASAAAPGSRPALQPSTTAAEPAAGATAAESTPEAEDTSAVPGAKPSLPSSSAAGKAPATKPAAPPLVVHGGKAPSATGSALAADAPAPSVIGIGAGSAGPLPNIVGGTAPKPVLQSLSVSQGVSQGLLYKQVQPIYPIPALNMHIEGSVQLLATISKTGSITAVKALSGDPLLTQAATDAVKQWKYKPYLLNGEPVEIQTQITVKFKLPH